MTPEQDAQQRIMLAAPELGLWLTRNNVGALRDERGRLVRYGLANETPAQNAAVKSGDLVGLQSATGRFVSVEVKRPGWCYTGRGREKAQAAWIEFVRARGGLACFATSPDDLKEYLQCESA